jgi:heavy metal sensor kinase
LYYAIWDPKGKRVDQKSVERDVPFAEPGLRVRGERREATVRSRDGVTVLVGRSVHEEMERLNEFLSMTILAGGAILVVALLGGAFLAGRVLSPIERITRTASSISASNLSERIDVRHTESELGRLAKTLNDLFERLQAAFERQTRFTADASHELRTPLSIILSHAELALRKERSAAEYRESIETCLTAAQRMKAVIEGLLTLARSDAGTLNLQKERVDLQRVVEETAGLLRSMADENKVSLSVRTEAVEVTGDRDRLREVVTNLVSNAIRYNKEGGRVDVTLRAADGQAVLSVADTGIGIPEKDRPHIFERFYRVDKARSRELGGSGLGLSITKWIVEAHRGSIGFESREGQGTTFTVRLST